MLEILSVVTICILSANQAVAGAALETIDGQGLLNLAKTEKHVIALFTTPDCQTCEEYETVVTNIREDLVDSLSAWVVKVVNSDLLRTYTPDKEPALVFFRNGIPLLYEGPWNDEEILSMFIENKECVIKGLTDDSFEHLTQASTGATTGDWLILFYSSDHIASLQLIAKWETIGAKLKGRINVARIDKYVDGAATARRFNVYAVPEILFLRLGKVYRYTGPYDIQSLVSFAKEGYKQIQGEKVPEPQSVFDDMIHIIVNWLREHPLVMKFGSMLSCILVIILVVSKFKQNPSISKKESQANDTNDDDDDDDEDEEGEEEDDDVNQKSSGLSQKKEN